MKILSTVLRKVNALEEKEKAGRRLMRSTMVSQGRFA